MINRSRHPLVDMAFTEDTDAKKIPLNVLLDLIASNNRLLQKLFYRLYRLEMFNEASFVYFNYLDKSAPNHIWHLS